ncbi:DNA (cytosine-5-)-methyltransferase [Methylophilaceae bacterium]|nr:DNA (cytosine-5-)-methyltransferase [Methylophilaceae bacterium]
MKKKYTVGGLFSGVGGIEQGFLKKGFEVLWSNDIDEPSSKTFKKNFNHKHILKDIHKLKGDELEPVDVLVGGFPCQAFSIAGYRKGFEDERGNLFFQIMRLVNELKEKPKVLLLENVKNFYTHDHGNTFAEVHKALEKKGYCVFHKVLNTSAITKVPQNRERTFIICFDEGAGALLDPAQVMSHKFNQIFPPKELKNTHSIREYLEKKEVDKKFFYGEEKYMFKELKETIKSKDTVYQWRRQYVRENKSNVCPTLTANMGTGGHNVPLILNDDGRYRKLTPRECFNLQGFPKSYRLPDDVPVSQLYKQAGNSVTVKIIEVLADLIKEAMDTKYRK